MFYILKKCFDESELEKDKIIQQKVIIKLKSEKILLKMK